MRTGNRCDFRSRGSRVGNGATRRQDGLYAAHQGQGGGMTGRQGRLTMADRLGALKHPVKDAYYDQEQMATAIQQHIAKLPQITRITVDNVCEYVQSVTLQGGAKKDIDLHQ